MRHRGSNSSIVSIVFAINQDHDEKLYVARWPKFFPAPESAARLPEAAVPSNKRAASAVALPARGGEARKTRRGMAEAGEQPTAAITGRMLMVLKDMGEAVSLEQGTWLEGSQETIQRRAAAN